MYANENEIKSDITYTQFIRTINHSFVHGSQNFQHLCSLINNVIIYQYKKTFTILSVGELFAGNTRLW